MQARQVTRLIRNKKLAGNGTKHFSASALAERHSGQCNYDIRHSLGGRSRN